VVLALPKERGYRSPKRLLVSPETFSREGWIHTAQNSNESQSLSLKIRGSMAVRRDKLLYMVRLLSSLRLAPSPQGPVFGLISQMVKGDWTDILLPILDRLLAEDVRLIVLGNALDKNGSILRFFACRYVSKFSYLQECDGSWVGRVLRGSHVLLAPTSIKPGDSFLTQALGCGVIPVAHAQGLRGLVQEYEEISNTGYGFIFYASTPNAFLDSVRQSIDTFHQKELWESIVSRATLANSS